MLWYDKSHMDAGKVNQPLENAIKQDIQNTLKGVSEIVPTLPAQKGQEISSKAQIFVKNLFTKDTDQFRMEDELTKLSKIGNKEFSSVGQSTSLMAKRISETEDEAAYLQMQKIVAALNRISERLEPKSNQFQNNWLGFGKEKKTAEYFSRFNGAQTEINEIIKSLLKARDATIKTSVHLKAEQRRIQENMHTYRDYLAFIDEVQVLAEKYFEQPNFSSLYPLLNSKRTIEYMDELISRKQLQLLSNMNVAAQAFFSFDLLIENSNNLFTSIETTRQTTVTALQTAITLSRSITVEQLTTEGLSEIESTTVTNVQNISNEIDEYKETITKEKMIEMQLAKQFKELKESAQKMEAANKKQSSKVQVP